MANDVTARLLPCSLLFIEGGKSVGFLIVCLSCVIFDARLNWAWESDGLASYWEEIVCRLGFWELVTRGATAKLSMDVQCTCVYVV